MGLLAGKLIYLPGAEAARDRLVEEAARKERAAPAHATRLLAPASRPTLAHAPIEAHDLSPDQREAFRAIMTWAGQRERGVLALGGYAGSGKTTVLAQVARELCVERGKRVAFLAPTAKAASVLRRKMTALGVNPVYVGTIHRFLYAPVTDEREELVGWARRYFERIETPEGPTWVSKGGDIPRVDLLVVDEASMVSADVEADIIAFGVPVLAVGDHGQLAPVHGRSTWMAQPHLRLEQIHRQAENNPILALATYVRERGCMPRDVTQFGLPFFHGLRSAAGTMRASYATRGAHDVALLCYTNRLRTTLNRSVHRELHGSALPTVGTQVICLRNSHDLMNGMRGRITSPVQQQGIWTLGSVEFPDEGLLYDGPFLTAQFGRATVARNLDEAASVANRHVDRMDDLGALLDYGYALTVHKAQGSQFRDVYVVFENAKRPNDYGRWLYTAITRASERLCFVETWS